MRGISRTTTFSKVDISVSKNGECAKCGKKCKRSKAFYQTLNPFNKNADGSVKTRSEILSELHAEARKWSLEPVYHSKCE
jgi:hypothetical protein